MSIDFNPHSEVSDVAHEVPPVQEVPRHYEVFPDGRQTLVIGDVERCKDFNHRQGDNDRGFQGDCGLVACENILRQRGVNVTENDLVNYAHDHNLCCTGGMAEIPVEHAISFPLPTKRWGNPGYAFFASPALRRPNHPLEQGVPDRWWVLDASNGTLLVYAMVKAVTFSEELSNWTRATLSPIANSIEEAQQAMTEMEAMIDKLAPAFFQGELGDAAARDQLRSTLDKYLPVPLQPQYRTLVPDFFTWLI